MKVRIFYHLQTKKHCGTSIGIVEVTKPGLGYIDRPIDSDDAKKIKAGYTIVIKDDLTLKLTAPIVDNSISDALDILKSATTKTAQQDKLIKLLLLERGITPK